MVRKEERVSIHSHYGVTKLTLILMNKKQHIIIMKNSWLLIYYLSLSLQSFYHHSHINFKVQLTLLFLYFISGKLRHKRVSNVPGSDSLSETFQDVAFRLPFFNLNLLLDLHFKIAVSKIYVLPDFTSPVVLR